MLEWKNKKYCSKKCKYLGRKNTIPWNKGIPQTEEVKRKLSDKLKVVAKEKGYGKWMQGKKLSVEVRLKMSKSNKDRILKGNHNFYIDGRTSYNVMIRHSVEYKLWREAVFKRDNYTCQWCEKRGVYLHADHIKLFSEFPELRTSIANGRTLCRECHYKRHSKVKAPTLENKIF